MSEHDRAPEEPDGAEPVMHSEDADPAKTDGGGEASEEGPVRRPLIRATLQLPEGTPATPREPPVFTSHQQPARGSGGRQPNRNGRFMRDGGPNSTTPNKAKKRSNRGNSQRARGDSGSSQPSGNRKWSSSRPDRQGQPRTDPGNRSPSSRRDRGRKR